MPLDPLPYQDDKPVGAADFYLAINATFRFLGARLGEDGLRRYWTQLGEGYMEPVWKSWRERGLPGIADYWRAFFAAEPGADAQITEEPERAVLEIRTCPAIAHLRAQQREIEPVFCQHCYFVSEAAAQKAGYTIRVRGGNGACRQEFHRASATLPEQNLEDIKSC